MSFTTITDGSGATVFIPVPDPEGVPTLYYAKVLADSISPYGKRLLTWEVCAPRFILAEINTHRAFSRNSASSRAIPPEKHIDRILHFPFVPTTFYSRIKGMGQGEAIEDQREAKEVWLAGRDAAVQTAERLMEFDIAKSTVNRVLEPYMWHTMVITATELENFFALRSPIGDEVDIDFPAQPEFQQMAILMRAAGRASQPRELDFGEWHLPYITEAEREAESDQSRELCSVSAGRAAKISFETQGFEEWGASIERADLLLSKGHMSPLEHQARPMRLEEFDDPRRRSNLKNWVQYRTLIAGQDNMVGVLEGRPGWEEIPEEVYT